MRCLLILNVFYLLLKWWTWNCTFESDLAKGVNLLLVAVSLCMHTSAIIQTIKVSFPAIIRKWHVCRSPKLKTHHQLPFVCTPHTLYPSTVVKKSKKIRTEKWQTYRARKKNRPHLGKEFDFRSSHLAIPHIGRLRNSQFCQS